MDEFLVFFLLLSIVGVVIGGSIVIHEVLETPLDKCLDNCVSPSLQEDLRLECNTMCVDKFAKCVEGEQDG